MSFLFEPAEMCILTFIVAHLEITNPQKCKEFTACLQIEKQLIIKE